VKTPGKERGCDGKMKLGDFYRNQADSLAKKHGKAYGAYKCPYCNWYHLTTKLHKRDDYIPLLYTTPKEIA
jgi:hypothetical protein